MVAPVVVEAQGLSAIPGHPRNAPPGVRELRLGHIIVVRAGPPAYRGSMNILALIVIVPLSSLAWQGNPPDLSGVWELNKTAGTPARNMPDRMRVKIEQQGSAFSVTMRVSAQGRNMQQTQKYAIGGESKNEMNGSTMTGHASWEGDTLVVRSSGVFMKKELKLNDRWSVSADGNTLTFRERRQFGDEPEGENVRIFNRQPAASWEADQAPQLAEEVFKNIQIFKGLPAQRLQTVMMNLTTWLGVECVHCHVLGPREVFAFEKDDKPTKLAARKMFDMVRKIGQDSYAGQNNPVTCWTCHRGHAKPESLPPGAQ